MSLLSASIVVMPFGRYAGRTLGWIAERDVTYLSFAQQVARQPWLRAALDCLVAVHGDRLRAALLD